MIKVSICAIIAMGIILGQTALLAVDGEMSRNQINQNTVVYKDHEIYTSQPKIPINFSMSIEEFAGAYIKDNISARMDDESYLTITIKDNGFLQINASSSLDLRNNVTMTLEGNSTLILNGGTLNVSENATLWIKENAKIVVNDSGQLMIYGTYNISCNTIQIRNAQLSGLYVEKVDLMRIQSAEISGFRISSCNDLSAEDSSILDTEIMNLGNLYASNTPSASEKTVGGMLIRNVNNISLQDMNMETVTIDNCENFTAMSLTFAKLSHVTISHLKNLSISGYNVSNLTVHANTVALTGSKIRGNDGEINSLTEAQRFYAVECIFERGLNFWDTANVTIVNNTIPFIKAMGNSTVQIYGWAPSKEVAKDKFEAPNIIVRENASVTIYRWLVVSVVSKNETPVAGATVTVIDSSGKVEVARGVTNNSGAVVFAMYSEKITALNDSNNDIFQGWYTVKVSYEDLHSTPETHSAIMNDSIEVKFVMEYIESPPGDNMVLIIGILIVTIIVLLLAYYFYYMTKRETTEPREFEKEKKKKEEWRTDEKPRFKEPPKEWKEKEKP
jgi:Na+-transporting methylmalonyl-CoA/oxaloacetate decarboxylase gamma subunit